MEEIWKNIEGYEGLYQVSNLGRVRSLKCGKKKILKPYTITKGYLAVDLFKDNKRKSFRIHRLVGQAFIDNPKNLPQINHIDENKENNCVDNLEWCDNRYNQLYSHSKPIFGINIFNGLIIEFDYESEVVKYGFSQAHVGACCRGERKTHKGYKWYFTK